MWGTLAAASSAAVWLLCWVDIPPEPQLLAAVILAAVASVSGLRWAGLCGGSAQDADKDATQPGHDLPSLRRCAPLAQDLRATP